MKKTLIVFQFFFSLLFSIFVENEMKPNASTEFRSQWGLIFIRSMSSSLAQQGWLELLLLLIA